MDPILKKVDRHMINLSLIRTWLAGLTQDHQPFLKKGWSGPYWLSGVISFLKREENMNLLTAKINSKPPRNVQRQYFYEFNQFPEDTDWSFYGKTCEFDASTSVWGLRCTSGKCCECIGGSFFLGGVEVVILDLLLTVQDQRFPTSYIRMILTGFLWCQFYSIVVE